MLDYSLHTFPLWPFLITRVRTRGPDITDPRSFEGKCDNVESKCPFGRRGSGSQQLWKIHQRQIATLDVPGVSADVFITLVLALLPVTTILTAGVDMQPPPHPHPPGFCAFVLCAWKIVFLIPHSDNFHRVNNNKKEAVFIKAREEVTPLGKGQEKGARREGGAGEKGGN